jgi:DDE superfamily endonuclease
MSPRRVVAVAAAYYVLFGALVQQSHYRRQRAVARSGTRPRTRHSFDELQGSVSRAEFTLAFRMSLETYANLLSLLKLDLTRDMRMASRSSGGRVDPEVRLALTIRMLSGASYLDTMMLFRVASSIIYDIFHRTIASIIRRIAMPCLPFQQNEMQNLALFFTNSRQPPNPLYGCVAALDGICIEVQKPLDMYGPRDFYCRKGMYAIPAQALVDANYRFLYLSARCAGSTPDGIARASSNFGLRLCREALPTGFWIAGDAAYRCRNGSITPWTSEQLLDDEFGVSRDTFNFYNFSLRMHVEQAFGMLVRRFGILWRKLMFSLPANVLVLAARFRLHHFCIEHGEAAKGAVLGPGERSVSDAAFQRWFRVHSKIDEDSYPFLSKAVVATWKAAILGTISLEDCMR